MLRFLARRIGGLVLVMFGMTIIMFVIVRLIPGDPVRAVLGYDASNDMVAAFREEHGLDRALHVQYVVFLGGLIRGDLGKSTSTGRPVAEDLMTFLPATVELALASIVISILVGMPLGMVAALNRGRATDRLATVVSLAAIAVPVFWLGLLLQLVFFRVLGWLPFGGRIGGLPETFHTYTGLLTLDAALNRNGRVLVDALLHLVLPAASLAALLIASIARTTRAALSQVLSEQYVTTARSKGLAFYKVFMKHALRNALPPIITIIGLRVGELFGGAVITETIFQWPGVGRYAVRAIENLDMAGILGFSLVAVATFAVVNLVVDVLYAVVDPRLGVR